MSRIFAIAAMCCALVGPGFAKGDGYHQTALHVLQIVHLILIILGGHHLHQRLSERASARHPAAFREMMF